MTSLGSYINEKEQYFLFAKLNSSIIQDICNKHYMEFCDSMDNIITMRGDVKKLNVGIANPG